MPTLMQKIRLAFKGWSRRRDEAQKEFAARNTGWGGQSAGGGTATPVPRTAPAAGGRTPDMDGLVVAFLDDSGVIAYYLDVEAGEVIDVRDGSTLAAPRYRRVPQRSEAREAADRRAFIDSREPGAARDRLLGVAASGEEFRRVLGTDRSLERAWYSFKNDRVLQAVQEWLQREGLG
jgi:hypothetical protein